nr:hypothetical protein [Tanacetum cinerariifolium]GEY41819.1 hypothetical protein [Tanacetum cinerariifolium]
MNLIATQQATLNNALVPSEKRLKIERCNAGITFTKPQKKKHIKSHWKILRYLLAIQLFRSLLKCISGKATRLDRLRESRTEILWSMYNQKNVNYVALLWEDFMYQADNRQIISARKEHMPYPRFIIVIINHFISKDNTISMRSRINLHTICDDSLLGTLKFVAKTKDCQKYGALIPDGMINQNVKDSKPYKTYYNFAIGKVEPKKARKFKKPASLRLKTIPSSPKEHTQKGKPKDTSEGTGVKPGVLDVSTEDSSDSEAESWDDSEEESDDVHDEDENDDDNEEDDSDNDDGGNDDEGSNEDSDQTYSDDDENPSFTLKEYVEEEQYEEFVLTPERKNLMMMMIRCMKREMMMSQRSCMEI